MANLSNINGKFVVEQTTGYVGVGTTDPSYPIEVLNASAEIALNASGASIYRLKSDSTDYFRINKNGVGDKLVISGGGDVGIGISVPTTKLHIGGTAPGDSIIRQDSTVSGTNWEIGERAAGKWQIFEDDGDTIVATFMSSGNVGIGTDSPAGKFEIKSAASNYTTAPAITFTDDTGVADSRWILGNIATNYGNFVLAESDSATTVNYSPRITVIPGGNVGIGETSPEGKLTIKYTSANPPTSGTTANSAIQILSNLSPPHQLNIGVVNAPSYGSYIQASDNNLAVNYSLLLQPNGGNVGIGTDSPSSYDGEADNLVVYDAITPGITIALPQTTAAGSARGSVLFSDGTSGNEKYRGGVIYDHGTGMGGVADTMYLRAAVNSYLVLNALGNVGIGTKTPSRELDIQASSGWAEIALRGNTNGGGSLEFFTNTTKRAEIFADTEDIVFRNTPTNQERMRISNTGIVTIGGGGNNTSSSNNFIPVKINTPYSTTASPQWSLQGWVATTDGADPFAMTSGETTKNVYMGIIGAAYMNQNRFSIIQGGAERLTINLTQTGGGGSQGFIGIGTSLPSQKLDVVGLVKHQGLDMTAGVQVDQTTSISVSLNGPAGSWNETGIDGTDIGNNGSYVIQVYSNTQGAGASNYSMYWTGTMSWYAFGTNSSNTSEIYLNSAGHYRGMDLELRTISSGNGNVPPSMRINFKSNQTLSGHAVVFKFRRLM
jgi:hypothetical protein